MNAEKVCVEEAGYRTTPAMNLGPAPGIMRRDPSDLIRFGGAYYVWYTRGARADGYDATVWYATSPDGHTWTERGEALARGPEGSWDEQSVFTPNILIAKGKYWLFYTGVPKPFFNSGENITKTAIGLAVAASPDGPWIKLDRNPVFNASTAPTAFDSLRVDDACLIVRDGKYWLYYKGRQWNNTPGNTKMGVAIAGQPEGPYVRYAGNPVVDGGHEVLVWPYGSGVMALIGAVGPAGIAKTLQYAADGVSFSRSAALRSVPHAPGAFRPEAFTESGRGAMIEWGLHIRFETDSLPSLERFDYTWQTERAGAEQPPRG